MNFSLGVGEQWNIVDNPLEQLSGVGGEAWNIPESQGLVLGARSCILNYQKCGDEPQPPGFHP